MDRCHPRAGKAPSPAHDGGQTGGRPPLPRKGQPRGEAAEQHRLQRDMVDDIGPLARDRARTIAASARNAPKGPSPRRRHGSGRSAKALAADALGVRRAPGWPRRRRTGVARGARHRQPVRAEIPILGDQEEQLRPAAADRRRGRGGIGARRGGRQRQGSLQTQEKCGCPRNGVLFNASVRGAREKRGKRFGAHSGDRCGAGLSAARCAAGWSSAATDVIAGLRARRRRRSAAAGGWLLGDIAPGRDWAGDCAGCGSNRWSTWRSAPTAPPAPAALAPSRRRRRHCRAPRRGPGRADLSISARSPRWAMATAPGRPFRADDRAASRRAPTAAPSSRPSRRSPRRPRESGIELVDRAPAAGLRPRGAGQFPRAGAARRQRAAAAALPRRQPPQPDLPRQSGRADRAGGEPSGGGRAGVARPRRRGSVDAAADPGACRRARAGRRGCSRCRTRSLPLLRRSPGIGPAVQRLTRPCRSTTAIRARRSAGRRRWRPKKGCCAPPGRFAQSEANRSARRAFPGREPPPENRDARLYRGHRADRRGLCLCHRDVSRAQRRERRADAGHREPGGRRHSERPGIVPRGRTTGRRSAEYRRGLDRAAAAAAARRALRAGAGLSRAASWSRSVFTPASA